MKCVHKQSIGNTLKKYEKSKSNHQQIGSVSFVLPIRDTLGCVQIYCVAWEMYKNSRGDCHICAHAHANHMNQYEIDWTSMTHLKFVYQKS